MIAPIVFGQSGAFQRNPFTTTSNGYPVVGVTFSNLNVLKLTNISGPFVIGATNLPAAQNRKSTIYVATTGNDSNSGTNIAAPLATIPRAILVASNYAPATILVDAGTYDTSTNLLKFPPNVSMIGQGNPLLLSTIFCNTNDPTSAVPGQGGARLIPGDNGLYQGFRYRCYPTDSNSFVVLWDPANIAGKYWSGIGATSNSQHFTNVTLRSVAIEDGTFDSLFVGAYNPDSFTNIMSLTAIDCDFGTKDHPAFTDTIALAGGAGSTFNIQNCRAYADGRYSFVTGGNIFSGYNTFIRYYGRINVLIDGLTSVITNTSPFLSGDDPQIVNGIIGNFLGNIRFRNTDYDCWCPIDVSSPISQPNQLLTGQTNITGSLNIHLTAGGYTYTTPYGSPPTGRWSQISFGDPIFSNVPTNIPNTSVLGTAITNRQLSADIGQTKTILVYPSFLGIVPIMQDEGDTSHLKWDDDNGLMFFDAPFRFDNTVRATVFTGSGSGITNVASIAMVATNVIIIGAGGVTNNTTDTYIFTATVGTGLALKDGNGTTITTPILNEPIVLKPNWRFTGTTITASPALIISR